jgi:hypothetical protein
MRSRLEAKWAALDQVRWRWEYEPIDFDGWIPDFVLLGRKQVFVDVKPIFERDYAVEQKIQRARDDVDILSGQRAGNIGNPQPFWTAAVNEVQWKPGPK